VPQVRCIGADGNMIGVMATFQAKTLAQQSGLDLVEISPNAEPPVCRIMDFGKFRYEQSRREKDARKHQVGSAMKEIKFHSNVGDHDYQTKVNHIRGFLEKGIRVKSSLYFRGRENAHRELGFQLMNRVVKDCLDMAVVEMPPKSMGNSIIMLLGPKPQKSQGKPAAPGAPAATLQNQPFAAAVPPRPPTPPPAPAPAAQAAPAPAPSAPTASAPAPAAAPAQPPQGPQA
jgi:translation initiation factor IF-3